MFNRTATRGLLAGLAAASLVSLAACSGGGAAPQGTTAPESKPPAEPVTIKYLHRLPDGEGMT